MLDEAILAMWRFRQEGLPLKRMGLNLSEALLRDGDFPDWLVSSVRGRDLQPQDFVLEVWLGALPKESAAADLGMQALKAKGFAISIDNFGLGLSTLSGMLQCAPAQVKVDRSIVALAGDPITDRTLGGAVVMARGMGATVVAEGIETGAQYAAARALGFDIGQGYAIAKPMAAAAFLDWAADQPRARVPLTLVGTNG